MNYVQILIRSTCIACIFSIETVPAEVSIPQNPPSSEVILHDTSTPLSLDAGAVTDIYEELISLLNLIITYCEQENISAEELLFMKQVRRSIIHRLMSILPIKHQDITTQE